MLRPLFAVAVALTAILAACGDDDTTSTPTSGRNATSTASTTPRSPTPSSVSAHTATPTPASTPVPLTTLASVDSDARLVFLRNSPFSFETNVGEIWASDLSGQRAVRLTPAGVSASYVALTGDPLSEVGYVYYVETVSDDTASIYRLRFLGQTPELVLTFEPWDARFADAALSPDQRHIVYSDRYGLQLLDLQSYAVTPLVTAGDRDRCLNPSPGGSIRACDAFSSPQWSPDGLMVTAFEGFYEGGQQVVVDPFLPGSDRIKVGTFGGDWSPDSQSTCTTSDLESDVSGLHIGSRPDWTIRLFLGDYSSVDGTPAHVSACSWISPTTLAIGLTVSGSYPDPNYTYAALYDLTTGKVTSLGDVPPTDEQCCLRIVQAAPDAGLVFSQYLRSTGNVNSSTVSHPVALDITSGEAYSVLQQGDWLIEVVTP